MSNEKKYYSWVNFKPCKTISSMSHSLHYGTGVFEGIRSFSGNIYNLENHIARLFFSASQCYLNIRKFTQKQLCEKVEELYRSTMIEYAYIRPMFYLSENNQTLKTTADAEVNFLLTIRQLEPDKKIYSNDKVLVSKSFKKPLGLFPINIKASYLYALYNRALKEVQLKGFDDVLILDNQDYISELSTKNIFFIDKDLCFHTPSSSNCLAGFTRNTVINYLKYNNMQFHQRKIHVNELPNFIACFATGTAGGIKLINSITSGSQEISYNQPQYTLALHTVEDIAQHYYNLAD